MKTVHNYRYFGFFSGLPYGDCDESYEDYRKIQNKVSKDRVLKHIDTLMLGLSSTPSYDRFTGEEFHAGLYQDGDFVFTTDFVRYYRERDIGIPLEYEKYLVDNNLLGES